MASMRAARRRCARRPDPGFPGTGTLCGPLALHHRARIIRQSVIDDDQLEILKRLAQDAFDCFGQELDAIIRRNDD